MFQLEMTTAMSGGARFKLRGDADGGVLTCALSAKNRKKCESETKTAKVRGLAPCI